MPILRGESNIQPYKNMAIFKGFTVGYFDLVVWVGVHESCSFPRQDAARNTNV